MAISITSTEVLLTSQVYSVVDIYNAAVEANSNYVTMLEDTIVIDVDVRLKDNATLKDINKNIIIKGDLFQWEKGCTVEFGEKLPTGQVINGCKITMPAPKGAYGFGNKTTGESGNLKLYGCTVDIFCFWSLFAGDNKLDIIGNYINGYGRLSGIDSVFKHNKIKRAHGRYAAFALKGSIKENYDNDVLASEEFTGSSDHVTTKSVIYHNPKYSANMEIVNTTFDGYDHLAFIESTSGGDSLTCLDCDIRQGYNIFRETDNVDFFQYFTFAPKLVDLNGNEIVNANVKCYDSSNTVLFETTSDVNGLINERVLYYFQDRDGSTEKYTGKVFIEITSGDITIKLPFNINKPFKDFLIFVYEGDSGSGGGSGAEVDYDRIQSMIDANCECVSDKLNIVENKVSTVLIALTDDIAEGQTILKGSGDVMVVS